MAVSEDLTKLSDELRKLSARAEEAEGHVSAVREKTKADIEADRDAARAVGEQQAKQLRESADEGRDRISVWWSDVQRSWDEGRGVGEKSSRDSDDSSQRCPPAIPHFW